MSRLSALIQRWRRRLPSQEDIFASRWLKPLAPWFDKPYFWHLNRRQAASAVAVGLFCGLMPGPTQMLSALMVAYFIRTHLPLAVFTTLYTNPFTYLPLYYLAYTLGHWVLYQGPPQADLVLPDWGSEGYWQQWAAWFGQFGKPLLAGVPLLGGIFAAIGYVAVSQLYRWYTLHRRRQA
ncbi:uncharacterized protein (DUF2062 family) [Neisseria sp. HSC-16F19]|nr:uncharacterized protein (DUF2062 family) [Neisseria sp. HSC-16F19]